MGAEQSVHELRAAAAQGDAGAQFHLGRLYDQGDKGVAQNHVEAARLYRLAAAQGDAYAQGSLGLLYNEGKEHKDKRGAGLCRDRARGLRAVLRHAAEQPTPSDDSTRALRYQYRRRCGLTAARAFGSAPERPSLTVRTSYPPLPS
jgi:hypothetical protein